MVNLKRIFTELAEKYSNDTLLINELWNEIEKEYSYPDRYYHTIVHLKEFYIQLLHVRNKIEDWDTILFSMFYHDIIYVTSNSDNEVKSAEYAAGRLKQLTCPAEKISTCVNLILATKEHKEEDNNDVNYFTDADLSILGQHRDSYSDYCTKIRKEYSIFNELQYNTGRKEVLQKFLHRGSIFKTKYFYDKFEVAARQNIKNELNTL